MSYLTHLECALTGEKFESEKLWNLAPNSQKPLLAKYDLAAIARSLKPADLKGRSQTLWRYRELLPMADMENALSLGEGWTPLIAAKQLGEAMDFPGLYIKEEGANPTTSFKARGMAVAVSRAKELGATALSVPSAGNAAGAMSAYAALAQLPAFVFMPKDVPQAFIGECQALGAEVTLIDGLITDCGRIAAEGVRKHNRFDLSTLKEPYRLEGKKTMGYELAEQMDWTLPDVIIYPTGGGTGLIGMWKAFAEMIELGWLKAEQLPRMVSVQAEGCAPMVRAFEGGDQFATPWENGATAADGLRVPAAVGDFLILNALRESGGTAVAVSDREMIEGANLIGRTQGIFASPEGGACLAAFIKIKEKGWVKPGEKVVLFNTGSGHKYAHLWNS